MAVIAGIDEAGYGPLLGPLVVSTAAVGVPEEAIDGDLWKLLGGAVTRKPRSRGGTLAIGDSKKLYNRKRANALQHLERGVLAMLATRGRRPTSLRQLLNVLSPETAQRLEGYPWYARVDLPLPHCISQTDLALASNALTAALADAGMTLEVMRSEVILVGEYNRTVRATDNKSTTLFDVNSRLLAYLWRRLWRDGPPGSVRVYADRHGGRTRYLRPLQRVFDGCDFKVLGETPQCSGYRIAGPGRRMQLHFGVKFDDLHLPVALASMTSKYLRELCMELLNRFWAAHVPDLAPTAGYFTDGKRFLADIAPALGELATDRTLLERCR